MLFLLSLLEPFQGFSSTERVERGGSHEITNAQWIDARILSKRPTDGFVDEEFLRAEVLADDVTQEAKIGILFVAKLEEDAGAAQPEVI